MSSFTSLRVAPLTPAAEAPPLAHDALDRTATGAPLAYQVGRQTFMGVELLSDPGALVPRAETELLGRAASQILADLSPTGDGDTLTMVDMCCGSGNLACGIASALPALTVHAADLTDGCVTLARRNVAHLGLGARVNVHQGDLFGALEGAALAGTVDVVVCNPPYISSGRLAGDRAGLLEHEPREAFDGGPYGLAIHQRLVREALAVVRPGGWVLCEFGEGQDRQVQRLFDRTGAYGPVSFHANEVGTARVAVAQVAVAG